MFGIWEKVSDWWATLKFSNNNSGFTVTSDGPGSLEFRFAALGNAGSARPWWRVLFNATSGIEIQNASNENFTDAANVLSFSAEQNINVNIDQFGVNLDCNNGSGAINVRQGDGGPTIGRLSIGPSPLGSGTAIVLSAKNLAGNLQPCLLVDPNDGSQADTGDNPVCIWVGGGWHRIRRTPEGIATVQ